MNRRQFLRTSAPAAAAVLGQKASVTARPMPKGQPWKFERVAGPFSFAEGPIWDGEAVLFTDIRNNRIMRFDPKDSSCLAIQTDTKGANGLALDKKGRLYACQGGAEGRQLVRYEADGTMRILADRFEGKRLNSPNDIAIDRLGQILVQRPSIRRSLRDGAGSRVCLPIGVQRRPELVDTAHDL